MKLQQHSSLIWTIDNFLSDEECYDLIMSSELMGYEEAKVSLHGSSKMMKGIRNNLRLLYQDKALAET